MRFLVTLLALVATVSGSCPQGAVKSTDGTKCYQFLTGAQEFSQAQQTCLDLGGNLASVANGYENNLLAEQAYTVFRSTNNTRFWLGGNDLATPGKWAWTDAAAFSYANWASGQPGNGRGVDCLQVDTTTGLWMSKTCFLKAPFVCESPVLHPSTCPPPPTCPTHACPTPKPCVQKQCHEYCPSTWSYFDKTHQCYKVFHGSRFWDAEANCVAQGGHLASVHSNDENGFIAEIASAYMTMANYHQTWIGLYSPKKDYTFAWTDGTPMDYKHWGSGLPAHDHNGKQACAMILSDESVWVGEQHYYEEWYNVDCDYDMRNYVCMKPVIQG